jgi:iodotyrosine deiodinase
MADKIIDGYPYIEYHCKQLNEDELSKRATSFYESMKTRRSVRHFSSRPIPKSVIETIIKTAASAPSGANKQPWTFVAIANPELKSKIREAAEKEEVENYNGRMSEDWLKDLAHLGTDWRKEFLEIAPWLIVVFKKIYDIDSNNNKRNNYYVSESVGLASGFLIAAIHQAGLVTLTHTPSPMNFLTQILNRPENERPFLLLPVGFPASDAFVPKISRKDLDQISEFNL